MAMVVFLMYSVVVEVYDLKIPRISPKGSTPYTVITNSNLNNRLKFLS